VKALSTASVKANAAGGVRVVHCEMGWRVECRTLTGKVQILHSDGLWRGKDHRIVDGTTVWSGYFSTKGAADAAYASAQ